MKTTKKQLANFAIGLIKELNKVDKSIKIEYQTTGISVWFFYKDLQGCDLININNYDDLKTNKDKFKKAILKIRGIIK